MDLPPFLAACRRTHEEALGELVRSGTCIGSGFATSEPHTFYAGLWDHIRQRDLVDLEIRQALFLTPHRLLVGEALEHAQAAKQASRTTATSVFGALRREARGVVEKAAALRALIRHYEELEERRIGFVSGFLGPALSGIVPANLLTRVLYPKWAGRPPARAGIVHWQSVHFPDAPDALVYGDDGRLDIDLFVAVMAPPDERGEMSHGIANGSNGDAVRLVLRSDATRLLLYLNPRYPFTRGHPESPNTLHVEELRSAAEAGRLVVVEDDGKLPALPADSFDDPSPTERRIAEHVVNHIEAHPELTRGRALQVGIGSTGVLAVRRLAESSWRGGAYTEMLEPFTMDLLESGSVDDGSHFVCADGRREELPGKLVCTFALGLDDGDLYRRMDGDERLLLSAASRVVVPEAFYGGLGINNVLGIDFQGHVNSSGRDRNPYSGVGGSATILRGLAKGGVAYLCLKSTHTAPDGGRRSSIFPYLPRGTPVSLIGPDLMGTREHARFFLVTEHGVARLNARSQDRFVRALVSVAHPDHRDWLAREAYKELRVRV